MKNLSLFAFLLCFSMQGLYAQVDLADSLQAYYPCNNSGTDYSGSATGPFNLIVGTGLRTTTDRFGNADAAFEYTNNVNSSTLEGGINISYSDHYSIAIWVRQDSTPLNTNLFKMVGGSTTSPAHFQQIEINLDGKVQGIEVDASQESFMQGGNCANSSSLSSDLNTMGLQDGEWHLLTLSRASDTMRLYVDTQMVEISANPANPCSANPFIEMFIGSTGFGDATVASFDDIMIYDRAINPQEVAAIYNLTATYNGTLSNAVLATSQTNFRIFPNPTQTNLTVTLEEVEAEQYRIYNALGQLVAQGQFVGQQQEINTTSLNAGFYQLVLQTNKGQQLSQQFVKQ
ncbi:T9SS type A sorting domain-containing protein [Saprospira sp. CCB-QB6]|uniref:LamG-like jellyroll fold domain-containing protein n=1 Tax=Saprospira sp. CCB-QB6 TaxID=3023936 RepID=UPI00234A8484|nr:LamG-like jellyroll fold domain-containing protein [Saprospira sp. CCB-QB6]WCL80987.1 T9SS type A sorting domain-containing protein [Saprospira sp. CCB-QB6]